MMPLERKLTQDQSTQVNFTLPSRKHNRTIARFATSEDIYSQHRTSQMSTIPNWNYKQNTLPRPKSLNFPVDPARSPVKVYSISDSPISRTTTTGYESQYSQASPVSRDRTNVLSCSPSITSNPRNGLKSLSTQKLIPRQIDEESSCCSCRCFYKGSAENNSPMVRFNERQSLSWRRLHMSRAKLKATSATSELLSGFAMVAMVELQINEPTEVPEWLFVIFAVCTTILVSVHIFALMISTYILPNIDAIAKMEILEWVSESPHERMRGFIEIAWAFSTVLGLFLFLLEVAILCWVKFWDYSFPAAIAATVIVIPVLIVFVLFAVHFYHSLVVIKCDTSSNDMVKLEDMKKQLDNLSNPV